MIIRTYTELIRLPTFEERFEYLKLNGVVSEYTFGGARYVNQAFYRSREWKQLRDFVIVRDLCCDLADPDRPLNEEIIIHHINPISLEDIEDSTEFLMNPEYLITTSLRTHNAIHYGGRKSLLSSPVERRSGDTCPWKN